MCEDGLFGSYILKTSQGPKLLGTILFFRMTTMAGRWSPAKISKPKPCNLDRKKWAPHYHRKNSCGLKKVKEGVGGDAAYLGCSLLAAFIFFGESTFHIQPDSV